MNRFYIEEKLSDHIGQSPEGFLICYDVPIARIGEQIYKGDEVPIEPNEQGLVTIKRTEGEVFKPEALQSFEGKPFTIDHPDEMVTPENWKELAHGFITNVRQGIGEKLGTVVADIVATTNKVIELIKGGMREISCGYDADYEQLDKGVGIQKNIIGNHIALVMRGRAGHRCAIGDKECNHCGNCKNHNNNKIEEDSDAMKVKDKLSTKDKLSKAYRKLIKDEDFEKLPDDEKADKLAEVAADEIEEEGQETPVEETPVETPVEETPVEEPLEEVVEGGGEITNAMLMESMTKLISIIEAFVKTAAGVGDEESVPDPMPGEEEAKPFINDEGETWGGTPQGSIIKKPVMSPGVADEDEDLDEKEERERMEAKDCDSRWHDIAYRADLLYPGIRLTKPTKDHKVVLDRLKLKALKNAFTADSEVVTPIIQNKKIDSLKGEALDMAFIAVSEAIKHKNNRMVKDSVIIQSGKVVSEIQGINQKNKEFWKKK